MTQTFETIVVLDFEATCQRGAPPAPQEVIEFPSVLVSLREQAVVDSFSSFVRPVHHPQLSEFCRQLTSIGQKDVDAAPAFPEVLARHQAWLAGHGLTEENFAFVTCGDWDLVAMMPRQCAAAGISVVTLPRMYRRWINIKRVFTDTIRKSRSYGMTSMLNTLKLPLMGTHHRGIDDCQNIARIALALAARGGVFAVNNRLPAAFYPELPAVLIWGDRTARVTLEKRLLRTVLSRASELFGVPMVGASADGSPITNDQQLTELPDDVHLRLHDAGSSEQSSPAGLE